MSATQTFSTQILGQTEKALGAILDQQLAGTGLTEPQWVTLSLTMLSGGDVPVDQLISRACGVLKVSQAEARAHITRLADAGLVRLFGGEVTLTEAGRRLHGEVRAGVFRITDRLWGDLPAGDLATAGRVLSIVLERANAELVRSSVPSREVGGCGRLSRRRCSGSRTGWRSSRRGS